MRKHSLLSILLFFSTISLLHAQWEISGGNIYNTNKTTGRVIIESNSTTNSPLEVKTGDISLWRGTMSVNTKFAQHYSSYGWMENGTTKWSVYHHHGHNYALLFANEAGLDKFSFHQNGNVGIGTITPASGLEVNSFQGGIHITDNDSNNFLQVGGRNTATGKGFVFKSTTNSTSLRQFSLLVTDGNAQQERLTILKDGSVGIGTLFHDNNPNNYKLAVNGTIGARS